MALAVLVSPQAQDPATPPVDETPEQVSRSSESVPLAEIIARAVARAARQDEAGSELLFESIVSTTVDSLNGDGEVTESATTVHRRYPLEGAVHEELIERNGQRLSEAEVREEEERREEFRRRAREAAASGETLETNDERQVRFNDELMARFEAKIVG